MTASPCPWAYWGEVMQVTIGAARARAPRRLADEDACLEWSHAGGRTTMGTPTYERWAHGRRDVQEGRRGDLAEHGGTAEGTVERKITADTEEAGRTVRASEEEPQHLVRSAKSGGTAVHKPSALTRKKG